MIVSGSSVIFSSQHSAVSEHRSTESLRYWTTGTEKRNSAENDRASSDQANMTTNPASVKVSLSPKSLEQASASKDSVPEEEQELMADLNMRILRALIERLTGKKVELTDYPQTLKKGGEAEGAPTPGGVADEVRSGPGFGLEYDLHEEYYEAEETSFGAQGVILTADGEKIDFDLQLTMKREFYEQRDISVRMGEALKDPLVVNFEGTSTELVEARHSFDIDADGIVDSIPYLRPESGFLVLDKNGDGVVNDGSELFGALTGNGFQELAQYDRDGNGWIDENDPVYADLRLWIKDEKNDETVLLEQKGIGAIYLESQSTPFALKTAENTTLGHVRSSGIYLGENRRVGSIQQVDLVV